MTMNANWSFPTDIRFGAGRIADLPAACRDLGTARPLLVTDAGLADQPIVTDTLAMLAAAGLKAGLFADVKSNPVGANLDAGLAAYRAGGHDGVIAFGGGSGLDCGKAIGFMSGQQRGVWDFEDIGDNWRRADPAGIAPIIAVPTTAGTGSEVGRAAVITDEESHTKKVIFHPRMLPGIVIIDPELTLGLPAPLTAATGMDAFAHCLEAYCAPAWHPMAAGIAVEGMRLVKGALSRAVADGADIEARADMMAAAAMGAVAFQKGLGAIHALSHPVGALFDSHHGLTNAIFMPYVLAFNRTAIANRIDRLAAWLELGTAGFDGFMEWVLALRSEIGIPHTLAGINVGPERADEIAGMAIVDPTAGGNPVPLTKEGARAIFDAALAGRV